MLRRSGRPSNQPAHHQSLMPKQYVNPNSLFPSLPHGFSQVVIASGKKTVFVSGQTAWDARKNIGGGDSVLEQARQARRNLKTAQWRRLAARIRTLCSVE